MEPGDWSGYASSATEGWSPADFEAAYGANTGAATSAGAGTGASAAASTGASTGAGSAFDFGSFNPADYGVQGAEKSAALEKFAGILGSGGSLTQSQADKLASISEKTGVDFSNLFSGIGSLGSAASAGTGAGGWTPSVGDQYQYLNPRKEDALASLAAKYASGQLEGREGKIDKLERILEKGQLGTLESFFSKDVGPYTTPTGLDLTLPTGVTYQSLADIYRSGDPLRAYVASERYGLTPEQILGISSGYQTNYYNPVQTRTGIDNLLYQGQGAYQDLGLARLYFKDPNNPIFVDNPQLANRASATIYAYQNPIDKPVTATTTNRAGETIAGSGQYGYYNNAPILNADVIDQLFGDKDRFGASAVQRNQDVFDEFGWNLLSNHDLNMGIRGVSVVGLNKESYTPTALKEMDKGETITTEDGVTLLAYGPERAALEAAAEKLGLDPDKYDSSAALYKAVDNATSNLYAITGAYKGQWDPLEISEIGDKGNHATVLYREMNGMLVPVSQPNLFKYEKPDDPIIGGAIGEMIGGIPFLPQIGQLIGGPGLAVALTALQTAARSGDVEDVFKNAGLAWLTTNYIPKTLGPYIQTEIATLPAVSQLANAGYDQLANFIIKGGTNAAISGGMAMLTGQNPTDAVTNALLQSGIFTVSNEGLKMTDAIPDQYKPLVANIVADTILGNDPKNSLTGIASTFIKDEFKDVGKKTGKTNEARSIETGM